jgi:hypothetical protein
MDTLFNELGDLDSAQINEQDALRARALQIVARLTDILPNQFVPIPLELTLS